MRELKYVIVKDMGCEAPIIFPMFMEHRDVAHTYHATDRVVSAGMCQQGDDGKWTAYGKSISLRVPSRMKEDSELLNLMMK